LSCRSCLNRYGTGAAEKDIEIEEAAQTDTELEQTNHSFSYAIES